MQCDNLAKYGESESKRGDQSVDFHEIFDGRNHGAFAAIFRECTGRK